MTLSVHNSFSAVKLCKAVKATTFLLLLLSGGRIFAQQPVKDSVDASQDSVVYGKTAEPVSNKEYMITSFEELNMPPEMMAHFRQLTPENIVQLRDEMQVTENNEDGVEVILTMKLRFSNNCLVGYIQEAPLDKTIQVTVSEYSVNIPIEWMCSPANKRHAQHYVSSLAGIKAAEDQYKCTDWHIKLQSAQVVTKTFKKKTKKGH